MLHGQKLWCQHICKQGKGTQPMIMLQTAASVCYKSWHKGLISNLGALKWLNCYLSMYLLCVYTHTNIYTQIYVSVSRIQGSSQIPQEAKSDL